MQLIQIRPGHKLLWRHTRRGLTTWQAARVVRLTRQRVWVLVMTPRGPARRCVRPERLSKRKYGGYLP